MADKKPTVKKATKSAAVTDTKDLDKTLADKQMELSQAIRSHKSGELVNPRVLRDTRRDIARLKTAIRANVLGKEK